MIQPINQNSVNASVNLEPVKVPHFAGSKKADSADSFEKASKNKIKLGNRIAAAYSKAKEATSSNVTLACSVTKDGAKAKNSGASAIKNKAKKALEFLKIFFKSLFDDSVGIIREKGTKTVTNVDNLL